MTNSNQHIQYEFETISRKFSLDYGEIRSIMTMQYINDSTLDTPQPLIKTLFYCIGCKWYGFSCYHCVVRCYLFGLACNIKCCFYNFRISPPYKVYLLAQIHHNTLIRPVITILLSIFIWWGYNLQTLCYYLTSNFVFTYLKCDIWIYQLMLKSFFLYSRHNVFACTYLWITEKRNNNIAPIPLYMILWLTISYFNQN